LYEPDVAGETATETGPVRRLAGQADMIRHNTPVTDISNGLDGEKTVFARNIPIGDIGLSQRVRSRDDPIPGPLARITRFRGAIGPEPVARLHQPIDLFGIDKEPILLTQDSRDVPIAIPGILLLQNGPNPRHDTVVGYHRPGVGGPRAHRGAADGRARSVVGRIQLPPAPGVITPAGQRHGCAPDVHGHRGVRLGPGIHLFTSFGHHRIPFVRRKSWSIAIGRFRSANRRFKRSLSSAHDRACGSGYSAVKASRTQRRTMAGFHGC
jgi:hypothetical protein